jgi:hypothetical protein
VPGRDEQVLERIHAIQDGQAVRRQRTPPDPEFFRLRASRAARFELVPAADVPGGAARDGPRPGRAENLVIAAELHRARYPQPSGERRDGDLDVQQVDGPPGQGAQPARDAVSLARGQPAHRGLLPDLGAGFPGQPGQPGGQQRRVDVPFLADVDCLPPGRSWAGKIGLEHTEPISLAIRPCGPRRLRSAYPKVNA